MVLAQLRRSMTKHTANNDLDPLARHSMSAGELKQLLAAERAAKPFLAFRDEEGQLVLFPISGENVHALGRSEEVEVSIDWDPEVSGLHAELHSRGGEWAILDDGLSTNGTYVNGQRVNGRQRLRDSDRIRVGQTILVYRFGAPAQVPPTAVAAEAATI